MTLVINQIITYKNGTLFNSTQKLTICKRLWIFVFCYKYVSKILRSIFSKKRFNDVKQFGTDGLKTALKRAI